MGRLIELDAAIDAIRKDMFADTDMLSDMICDGIEEVLKALPPVDAVPVRHGRWKPFDLTYGRNLYACSVCGDVSDCATVMGDVVYQFCPYCGAKMDGTQ